MQRVRETLETGGVRIVLVHMADDAAAASLFGKYGLDDVPRISDPQRRLYEVFELNRAGLHKVVGPAVWWKGFKTTILQGHLPGKPVGDILQLPGTFLLRDGEIVRAHRPDNSADRPEFVEFAGIETDGD